ncbi:hypothetical protein ACDI35_01335 [Xanthomonas axonopodis pv. cajani]|uniref:hypothetical protein n=1 Tax=Xanthomonas axonopodis TaxID=53413 RepID=UPI0035590A48
MLLALPIGGVLYVITAALKSSDVYRDAVQIAKTDARVVQLLGTPITEDVSINGSIRYSGPTGEAQSASGCTPARQGQRAGGCHAQAWPLDLPDTAFSGIDGGPIDVLPAAASSPPPRRP